MENTDSVLQRRFVLMHLVSLESCNYFMVGMRNWIVVIYGRNIIDTIWFENTERFVSYVPVGVFVADYSQ